MKMLLINSEHDGTRGICVSGHEERVLEDLIKRLEDPHYLKDSGRVWLTLSSITLDHE